MTKLSFVSAIAVIAMAGVSAPAFSANMLSNGSFENGLTDWTVSDTVVGNPQGHTARS